MRESTHEQCTRVRPRGHRGGSAGLTAARTAGRFGARTLLVERDRLGGDCLWTGCVPSKALLHVAAEVHAARGSTATGSPRPPAPPTWPP